MVTHAQAPSDAARSYSAHPTDDNECAICLFNNITPVEVTFTSGGPPFTLACSHTFHVNCIGHWYDQQDDPSCPLCKKNINQPDIREALARRSTHVDSDFTSNGTSRSTDTPPNSVQEQPGLTSTINLAPVPALRPPQPHLPTGLGRVVEVASEALSESSASTPAQQADRSVEIDLGRAPAAAQPSTAPARAVCLTALNCVEHTGAVLTKTLVSGLFGSAAGTLGAVVLNNIVALPGIEDTRFFELETASVGFLGGLATSLVLNMCMRRQSLFGVENPTSLPLNGLGTLIEGVTEDATGRRSDQSSCLGQFGQQRVHRSSLIPGLMNLVTIGLSPAGAVAGASLVRLLADQYPDAFELHASNTALMTSLVAGHSIIPVAIYAQVLVYCVWSKVFGQGALSSRAWSHLLHAEAIVVRLMIGVANIDRIAQVDSPADLRA